MEQMILPKGKICLAQANKVDSVENLVLSHVLFQVYHLQRDYCNQDCTVEN